jgi:hypothetical protein
MGKTCARSDTDILTRSVDDAYWIVDFQLNQFSRQINETQKEITAKKKVHQYMLPMCLYLPNELLYFGTP